MYNQIMPTYNIQGTDQNGQPIRETVTVPRQPWWRRLLLRLGIGGRFKRINSISVK